MHVNRITPLVPYAWHSHHVENNMNLHQPANFIIKTVDGTWIAAYHDWTAYTMGDQSWNVHAVRASSYWKVAESPVGSWSLKFHCVPTE